MVSIPFRIISAQYLNGVPPFPLIDERLCATVAASVSNCSPNLPRVCDIWTLLYHDALTMQADLNATNVQ